MTGACLTVSQVQSIPWAAAPSSASLLLVTSVFVTPIVTRGNAAKPCTSWAAAAVGAPVSLGGKETGKRLAQEMATRISCCRAAKRGHELPQWAYWKKWHPSHCCDRASRRTLIALGVNHPQCGVASKVLATWVLSRTALVRFWFSARSARRQQHFGGTVVPIGSAG